MYKLLKEKFRSVFSSENTSHLHSRSPPQVIPVTNVLQQNSKVCQGLAQSLTSLEMYSSSCYRIYALMLMLLSQSYVSFSDVHG